MGSGPTGNTVLTSVTGCPCRSICCDMNKALSIAFLVGGAILLIFGFQASGSFSSDVSRAFTGNPTDKAMWMIGGGAVLAVIGLIGLFTGRSRT